MGDSGQAAVEAALVLPLLVLAGLVALQLAAVQQARLLTGYAAFCAARAGSVWGGNGERMRDAALFALLPALGPAGDVESLGRTWTRAHRDNELVHDELLRAGALTGAPLAIVQAKLAGVVRVDVLSPSLADFTGERRELDFDTAGLDGAVPPPLSIRVRYWHELRLPIANGLLFRAWLAGTALGGRVEPAERRALAALASGGGGQGHRYFLPLEARWTVRLQSAFQRKWLGAGGGGR